MPITEDQRDLLMGVIAGIEKLDKVTLTLDAKARKVTIVIEDLDDDYVEEIAEALP